MKNRIKKGLIVLLPLTILLLITLFSLLPPEQLPQTAWWLRKIPHPDKIVHFFFYFSLITALRLAKTCLSEYTQACRWRLLILAALYGGAIELLQGAYFGRGCELWDEVANIAGAAAAIWLIPQRWYIRLSEKINR